MTKAFVDALQFDLQDLLTEVRARVAADTAVVLLVDASGRLLVPAASVGIDRAGRTAMRIRVGRGVRRRSPTAVSPTGTCS